MPEDATAISPQGVIPPMRRWAALTNRLEGVVASLRWWSSARRVGEALWNVPLALCAIVLIDTILPMPDLLRAALGVAMIALLLRALFGLIPDRAARRAGPARAARVLESRLDLANSEIVSALQLAPLAGYGGASGPASLAAPGLRESLAARAIDRAAGAAARAEGVRIVDTAPAKRAWQRVLLACAVTGLLAMLLPRVFAFGLPRLAQPFAGHPPYTLTNFDISLAPSAADVCTGDDVRISVAISGKAPPSLDVVFLDASNRPIERVPMTPLVRAGAPAGESPLQHAALLRALREPVRFYLSGFTGRSDIVQILPTRKPRLRSATLTVTPPAYTGWSETTRALSPARPDDLAVRAIVGSEVELRVVTTLPLAGAESDGVGAVDTIGATARERLHAKAPGKQTLSLRPYADAAMDQAVAARVDIIADRPPEISVEAPGEPDEKIYILCGAIAPVLAGARDDVRISGFGMSWEVRAEGDTDSLPPKESGAASFLDPEGRPADHAIGAGQLDTLAMAVMPGDVIALRISCTDNRPPEFGGAQTTTVGPILLHVVDDEQMQKCRGGTGGQRVEGQPQEGDGECQSEGESSGKGGKGSAPGNGQGNASGKGPGSGPIGGSDGSKDGSNSGGETGEPTPGGAEPRQGAERNAGAKPGDFPAPNAPKQRLYTDLKGEARSTAPSDQTTPATQPRTAGRVADKSSAAGQTDGDPTAGALGHLEPGAPGQGLEGALHGATLADVPPAYRELVSQYFLKLAREERERNATQK